MDDIYILLLECPALHRWEYDLWTYNDLRSVTPFSHSLIAAEDFCTAVCYSSSYLLLASFLSLLFWDIFFGIFFLAICPPFLGISGYIIRLIKKRGLDFHVSPWLNIESQPSPVYLLFTVQLRFIGDAAVHLVQLGVPFFFFTVFATTFTTEYIIIRKSILAVVRE